MRCGLCLPTCPTYAETGRERNSPRGRIALMRAVADGELGITKTFAEEMSYCLGCLACTSACPAGVDFSRLLETARADVEGAGPGHGAWGTVVRALVLRWLFVRPRALRAAGRLLRFWQLHGRGLARLLPGRLRELESQAPRIREQFSDAIIAAIEPARGSRRYRVALLTGCVQDLAFSEVNRATADVLRENGCEVITPRLQHCCGSLHAHNGDLETARLLARRQIEAVLHREVDAIISNAAGCGSHLKHLGQLLADDSKFAAEAAAWSGKVRDISEWLVEIGLRKPETRNSKLETVTYHEACHLCHGQKISRQPREVLAAIGGLELRELREAAWCCGSAGIYNLTQPQTAAWLQARKLENIKATRAAVIATGNPGCHVQIENALRAAGDSSTRVVHPVVLLAEAYERVGTTRSTQVVKTTSSFSGTPP